MAHPRDKPAFDAAVTHILLNYVQRRMLLVVAVKRGDIKFPVLSKSATHGLNEKLGRHRGREGIKECLLCDDECESVSHVLWECPAYSSLRSNFLVSLQEKLGDDGFEHFQSLDCMVYCYMCCVMPTQRDSVSQKSISLHIV